jgi:protein involved in polysaccharide export with SLBB domain
MFSRDGRCTAMALLARIFLVLFFGAVVGNAQRLNADEGEPAGQFTVDGDVLKPGPQALKVGEKITFTEAISRAGGFGVWANPRKVRITRRDRSGVFKTTVVDLKAREDSDHSTVRDGDHIYVPKVHSKI